MTKKDKVKNKSKVRESGRVGRGSVSKEKQIARLKDRMTPEQIAEAERWAGDAANAAVVRLAFKLLPSPPAGLSGREERFYQELLEINSDAAETWRRKKLASREQKSAGGKTG